MTFGTYEAGRIGAKFVSTRDTQQPNPSQPNRGAQMNMNRQSRRDDVLFVIALLVPAIFAGARYAESSQQMALIAKAAPVIQVVQTLAAGDLRRG
jgi:hypothetical protein